MQDNWSSGTALFFWGLYSWVSFLLLIVILLLLKRKNIAIPSQMESGSLLICFHDTSNFFPSTITDVCLLDCFPHCPEWLWSALSSESPLVVTPAQTRFPCQQMCRQLVYCRFSSSGSSFAHAAASCWGWASAAHLCEMEPPLKRGRGEAVVLQCPWQC